jgi:hypothetical protein
MSAILDVKPSSRTAWLEWLLIGAGLIAVYGPVFYELGRTLWQEDEYAHGPIILAVIAWLSWRSRHALVTGPVRPARITGLSILVFGLVSYVLGHSQTVTILQVGSLGVVLTGLLLAMRGWETLRRFWFPIFFVVFLVPLPGFFVDAVTGSLKEQVSQIAEAVLYSAGYPMLAPASTRCSVFPRLGCCTYTSSAAPAGCTTVLSLPPSCRSPSRRTSFGFSYCSSLLITLAMKRGKAFYTVQQALCS